MSKKANMTHKNNNQVPDEAVHLVPWYATGWLSNDERVYFKEQLDKYPELQTHLDEEKQIIHLVRENKSLLDLSALEPTEERLHKVLHQLGEQTQATEIEPVTGSGVENAQDENPWHSLRHFFHSLLSGNSSKFTYASFVSVAIISALLIAFIAPIIVNKNDTVYYPASEKTPSTQKNTIHTELLIGIKGDTQINWLTDFLHKNNAHLSKIEGQDGMYRLILNKHLSKNETQLLLQQLKNHDNVWFAGESY